jgi:diguanylate cyclase (GGDEF)-like protein
MSATVLDRVLSSPNLPTLPGVAVKVLQLARNAEVRLGDIADVVQYDQALSGRILRTINSSYYGLSQPCPTIKRALAYMGLNSVRSLVLGFSLVDVSRRCADGFELEPYWRRCIYAAAAARRIAATTESCDPDEAFIAALMQDVGMLAMHMALGSEYDDVVRSTNGNHAMLPYTEGEALGVTHAEAGARLGERWSLPAQLIEPIRQHHQRGTPSGPHSALVNSVILAYRISNLLSAANRKPVLDMVSAMSQSMFRMKPQDERAVLLTTTEDAKELAELLGVPVGGLPDIESILAEADDLLIRLRAGDAPDLAGPQPAGAGAAPRSPVSDQATFEAEFARRFHEARQQRQSLGLILVNADRMGAVNETLGRVAGDLVLDVMGQRLQEGLGGEGMICRCPGDCFAVMLPGASRLEAARIAERLRRQVERRHFDLRDTAGAQAVQMTASIGVAVLDAATRAEIYDPDLLLKLAERALATARSAGRNCVRLHDPKSGSRAA